MSGPVSLADVVEAAVAAGLARVELQVPARVEEYDAAKQVVRVAPLLRELVEDGDGSEEAQALPVVDFVPVEWPGAGGARLTFPIQVGDTGVLAFSGRSLDEWKAAPNRVVTPADNRRHAFMDAVFRPGLKSPAAPWTGARTDAVTLGYDGSGMQVHITSGGIALGEPSPAYAVALAEKVAAELSALKAAITSAVPVPMDGGTSLKATILAALSSWPASVGSATVKAKE